jgi:hypothetical protein
MLHRRYASNFKWLLEFVEPFFLLVGHAIDAEIDGLGIERRGVDAEEPFDEALFGRCLDHMDIRL